MSFQLGPQTIVINDPAQVPVLFFAKLASGNWNLVETDDDFETSVPFDNLVASPDTQAAEGDTTDEALPASTATAELVAQADIMRIQGFGDFEGASISEVIGTKGCAEQKQVATITFAGSGYTGLVGSEVTVAIKFASTNLEGEFATHLSDYKRTKFFTLTIASGETATTLAAKLVAEINHLNEGGFLQFVTATSSAGVVTITGKVGSVSWASTFSGSATGTAALTAVEAVTTVAHEGRNTYEILKNIRLQTSGSVYPHALDQVAMQLPVKGAKYSSYLITKTVSRPDLTGNGGLNSSVGTATFQYLLFINETTCAAVISNITKWLNANAPVRKMYTATTAAAILSADTVVSATSVDAAAPFSTPLV